VRLRAFIAKGEDTGWGDPDARGVGTHDSDRRAARAGPGAVRTGHATVSARAPRLARGARCLGGRVLGRRGRWGPGHQRRGGRVAKRAGARSGARRRDAA
jgi:hypothetical protein